LRCFVYLFQHWQLTDVGFGVLDLGCEKINQFYKTHRRSQRRRARKKVAHGETVGLVAKKFQAPAGATENHLQKFSFAPPGLCCSIAEIPRFHRGLLSFAAPQLEMDFENEDLQNFQKPHHGVAVFEHFHFRPRRED